MTIKFSKIIKKPTFMDPRNNFSPQTLNIEIRKDPLTGRISRIFPFRAMALPRHDWSPYVEKSKQGFCPFCPSVVEKVTPEFTADIAPEGRIKAGDALVIPNLNPYEKHASIVIMSPEHYISMEKMDDKAIMDSFQASLIYLERVAAADPEEAYYPSINWNYMPFAGASLIHPHWHALSGATPTTFCEQLIHASNQYYLQNHQNYWTRFVETEMQKQERYIGQTGDVHWISAFAPRHICEIIAVLPDKQTIQDITHSDVQDLTTGLKKVITYYDGLNLPGLNMAMYFARSQDRGFNVHVRIVGRFTINPLVGSDITHMQILHDDPWTVILPEDMTGDIKTFFNAV